MHAVRGHRRGGPDQLVHEPAPRPAPGPDEVRAAQAAGAARSPSGLGRRPYDRGMDGGQWTHLTAPVPASGTGLVGRDAELREIARLLARARDGGGALVLAGEPGIGKSDLLLAAREQAGQAGFRVLSSVGSQVEAELPYVGLRRLLADVLDGVDLLPDTQRRALLTALGVLDGPAAQPFLVALAALNLLAETATRTPVLVCVDDLQWLDRPSADVVGFVARRLGYDPVVLLATSRTQAGERPVPADLPRLDLGALAEQDARRVVEAVRGDLDASVRDEIVTVSQGNPLALVELSAHWRTGPPGPATGLPLTERLEDAFVGRLRDLPAGVQDAVLVAAAESTDDLAEVLAATALLHGAPVTADDLEAAVVTGLLRFDGLRVSFRHPLVRSGVLQGTGAARLRAAHAAVAELLTADPYRRSWHQALSVDAPDEQIAMRLESHHVMALQRGSVVTAIQMLERAAQLSVTPDLAGRRLLLAAELGFGLGRADLVRRLLATVARTDISELDRVRMTWLEEIFEDGEPGNAAHVLSLCAGAARAAEAGDLSLALNLLVGAALRCWWAESGATARSRVVTITRSLRGAESDPRYVAALAVADPVREGAAVHRMLYAAWESADHDVDADHLRLLGMAAHAMGEQSLAVDFLDRAEARLRAQGRLGLLPQVLSLQVVARIDLGDWRRAVQAAEEGVRLATDTGQPIWTAGTLAGSSRLAALQGDIRSARKQAAEAEAACLPKGISCFLTVVGMTRGSALITEGRFTEAYDVLATVFDPAQPCYHQRESYGGLGLLAEAASLGGRRAEARALFAELTQGYGDTPAGLLRVQLHYADAVLAEDEDAGALFDRALAQDLTRWPWPRARLELAHGSWLRRRRRVAESRVPLRSALATFEAIGAVWWAEQTREALRASGERAVSARSKGAVADLTPQELQIARLAAEGLSNRHIGEQLYLSPRTVGSHLYRIFPKLGVTARGQLAAALRGL